MIAYVGSVVNVFAARYRGVGSCHVEGLRAPLKFCSDLRMSMLMRFDKLIRNNDRALRSVVRECRKLVIVSHVSNPGAEYVSLLGRAVRGSNRQHS